MTPITIAGLNLQKGETAHVQCAASLMESRNVSVGYEGGSRGMSFRICKGVTYRIGAQRGRLIRERQLTAVSSGILVLTNRRAIYIADSKSFTLAYDSLTLCEVAQDALMLGQGDKTRLLKCDTGANVSECLAKCLSFSPSIVNKTVFTAKKETGCGAVLMVCVAVLIIIFAISKCSGSGEINSPLTTAPTIPQPSAVSPIISPAHQQSRPIAEIQDVPPAPAIAPHLDEQGVTPSRPVSQVGQTVTFTLSTGRVMSGKVVSISATEVTIKSLTQDAQVTIKRDVMQPASAKTIFGP